MSVRKTQSFCISRSSLRESLTDDSSPDEDYEKRVAALLRKRSTYNNCKLRTSRLLRPLKHVAVQTTPEIDEKHYSWLLNMESKADALYVDMSNLLNTLIQAKNLENQRMKIERNPLSLILNRAVGDVKKNTKPEKNLPETSSCGSFTAGANLSAFLMLQNIETKVKNVLKRASELRNSIPVVNIENIKYTSDKSVQTISPERQKNNVGNNLSKKNLKKGIHAEFPNLNNTKNDPCCTQKTVTSKVKRSATQMSFINGKNTRMLKKQSSCLNSDCKKDFDNSKTAPNSDAKEILSSENVAPESSKKATGAIPKKTKDLHVNVPRATLKRTEHQVTGTSKTKQVSFRKPVWR